MEDPDRLLEVIFIWLAGILVEEVCEELRLSGISGLTLDPECTELNGVFHHPARGIWFLQSAPQRHVCQDCNRVGFKVGT